MTHQIQSTGDGRSAFALPICGSTAAPICRANVIRQLSLVSAAAALAGCNRVQSSFAPFGSEAAQIRDLMWVMAIGALVIAVAMAWLVRHAVRAPEGALSLRGGMRFIAIAGVGVPSVVLLALLVYALPLMRPIAPVAPDLRMQVEGEQFWWRVHYRTADGQVLETANEVRLPAARNVAIDLTAADVIHSFWIPGLGRKMDMIPGRENELVVRAEAPGVYRGVCTEFCGLSHALMAFDVVVMEPEAFDRWLAEQAQPAPDLPRHEKGRTLFADYGCGGCHTVRGHGADGAIGPDLTHMGARRSLAAGTLPMEEAAIADFIRDPSDHKPGARMPGFPHMPARDAQAIADYLRALR